MSRWQENLGRLLRPRHIAFIGGTDAAFSARCCAQTFDGPIWGVNPNRQTLGGNPCYPTVDDLPEPPDAVFLATPRSATTDLVRQLAAKGAGGVACFTAGFGELGPAGQKSERALVEAAGDMVLVGPNCYGLINFTNGAKLWPFGSGNRPCSRGFALIMQSGMLPANCTMNDRSAPISYVISAGNQAAVSIEDFIDALIDDAAVTAVGLYIEGIRDLNKFSAVALRALEAGKPIVVLKAGSSTIGSQLAVTHTGSLAGADDGFRTFFHDHGIIRVDAPTQMLETLKFLSVSGIPRGRRIAAFTCSGGDAAMLADYGEKAGLSLAQPGANARQNLRMLLPDIATVSNPLDYTTPLWGNRDIMPRVFGALMADNFDAAVVIQDFPPPHIHPDNTLYRNDAESFADAANAIGLPAAVCSDLPENIDADTRARLIERGITPLQGLDNGIDALAAACEYGIRRHHILSRENNRPFESVVIPDPTETGILLDEWQAKCRLRSAGITVPHGQAFDLAELASAADELDYPVVLKRLDSTLTHKSEAGAVRLNLVDPAALLGAADDMQQRVAQDDPDGSSARFLVESMITGSICELLVGIQIDPQFGQLLVLGSGGVLVELVADTETLLLPTTPEDIDAALNRLRINTLLAGYRGAPPCDREALVRVIHAITAFAQDHAEDILEMDINPLIVTASSAVAADVLLKVCNH